MAWFEVHDTLPKHRKTLKLQRLLGTSNVATIGHLIVLWGWVLQYGGFEGLVGPRDRYLAHIIARVCYWDGPEDLFLDSLLNSGFLEERDGNVYVHEWYGGHHSNPNYVARAAFNVAARTLRDQVLERDEFRCCQCGTTEDLTLDHIHPLSKCGSNELDNLQTLCRSCNSRNGARLDGSA